MAENETYGCGWEVPRRDSWLVEHITRAEWEELLRYDSTVPNGFRVGKRWRRTDADGDWVGHNQLSLSGGFETVFRRAIIADAPEGER